MKKDEYLQLLTNNEIIQAVLEPKENAMFALVENNIRLAKSAKYDKDLSEEDRTKMAEFCISKSVQFFERKGLNFEEAFNLVTLLTVGIKVQEGLQK